MSKILIIDDERELVFLTSKRLRRAGYEVSCYYQGSGAMEEVRKEKPDLILLDVILPDISGFDVFEELRCDENLKEIPVVFFSALMTLSQRINEKKIAAEGLIEKPYTIPTLLKVVHEAMLQKI